MSKITLKIEPPMTAVRKDYANRIKKLKNLKTVYSKVSIFLDRWVQTNFRTQGGKVGGWKKLASGGRYVGKGKNKRFDKSAKVLQDTGRLKASFLPFANNKDAGIGSELPYSKTHEEGEGVPKRRILPLRKEVWPAAKKIIVNHIKKSISR